MKRNTKKTIGIWWSELSRFSRAVYVILFFAVVAVCADLAGPYVLRDFFNIFAESGDKSVKYGTLIYLLMIFIGMELISWISWRVISYTLAAVESKTMANIANRCFSYMHNHSYDFFNSSFSGALVKKVSRFVSSFERMTDLVIFEFWPMAWRLLLIISVLLFLHPFLGIAMFVWTAVFLGVNYLLAIFKQKYDIASAAADTQVTAALADTITNNVNIKLFAAIDFEKNRFLNVTYVWYTAMKKRWDIGNHIETGQSFFMILLEVAIMFIAIRLWTRDLITVGDLMLIQLYMFSIFRQLWGFGRNIRDLYRTFADAEEMTIILKKPHNVRDKKGAKDFLIRRGDVEFRRVVFSYDTGEEAVIGDLSFKVRPGQKVALIGPSGGGKSTITKLLLRLYDLKKGKILIDGKDVSRFKQDSLRSQVALVPQDPILFHRTLMENIRYGRRDATDEEVVAAAKMAFCHDFIMSFSHGYDTYVGERGVKLSGGQRQRVAIARAILSNAKILILDEATSSLDSESEMLIQRALTNLMKNRTTFIIAHRLSTVMKADKIFVIENGGIVEEGTHADLVNKNGSMYGKLWDLQVGGYG